MGTGSFPGVKRPGRGVENPPPFSADVKERVELNLYSPSGPLWPVRRVNFTFTCVPAIVTNVRFLFIVNLIKIHVEE
jgi:hypothetical protein